VLVCLMIEGQENVTWAEWLGLALAAEEHGFHALFRSDHYVSFGHPEEWGALDAWTTIAALSTQTVRIRLGSLVSPVGFRHPSNLAKSVTTADHVSGGRVELGLGAGWFEGEHAAYGFPFPPVNERYDVLEEYIEVVHRLWDQDERSVTFGGRHFQLQDCHALPEPLQGPHPPLIVGGSGGPRSVGLAARWADEYNLVTAVPAEVPEIRDRLDAACISVDRDPASVRRSVMAHTLAGSDAAELESRAARLMQKRGESGDPAAYLANAATEGLVGTPAQIVERLSAYAEVGIQRVMLQHLLHEDLEALALIGRDVIPAAATM
jgi:F420-dependent oxidoreductase-like protein